MKCPVCFNATLFITSNSNGHHAFCTACHERGASAQTEQGAYYNYKDKRRQVQKPIYDWKKARPDIFGYEVKCFGRV